MLTYAQRKHIHVTDIRNCVQEATKELGHSSHSVGKIAERTIELYMQTVSFVPLDNPPGITLPKAQARCYSDALADVLQWFHGFCAAVAMRGPDAPTVNMPTGLHRLTDLNLSLKKGLDQ